ncbi:MAG: hypothetical protein WDW38_008929 [Sanguina aurantia]
MGVKWLLRWAPPSGTPVSPDDDDQLQQLLLRIGASPVGAKDKAQPHVQCAMMHQAAGKEFGSNIVFTTGPGGLQDVWSVTFTQSPALCYFLIRKSSFVVEADVGMAAMMQRRMDYQVQSVIEFESTLYPQGDFVMRLLTTRHLLSGSVIFLGYALEVEYTPISDPAVAEPMLSAFVEMLQDQLQSMKDSSPDPLQRCSLVPVPSNFPKFTSLPQRFSPSHSAVAYVDLATSMATTHNYKSAGAKTQALQRGAVGSAGTPTAAATPPL